MAAKHDLVVGVSSKAAVERLTVVKKPKNMSSHPPTSEMVTSAIKTLKKRGGSSLQAIKKFVAANYLVDVRKIAHFINKYLRKAVQNGDLIRTRGRGALGYFKLSKISPKTQKASMKAVKKKTKLTQNKNSIKKQVKPISKKSSALLKLGEATAGTEDITGGNTQKKSTKPPKITSKQKKI